MRSDEEVCFRDGDSRGNRSLEHGWERRHAHPVLVAKLSGMREHGVVNFHRRGITVGTEEWAAAQHANWSQNRRVTVTVLVVDDEPIVRDVIVRYLQRDGFDTLEAGDGDRARELIETADPALVVLDVMIPGTDGLELCRWIRSRSDLPVIMLTARGEESDRIVGLELGADDYVTKPFSPRELSARVRTVLRRTNGSAARAERLEYGDVVLDGASREVTCAGVPVTLTAREFDLLWFLAANPRRVFSRSHIMDSVWGHSPALDTGTVTVHVRRLREKLEADPAHPAHLQTVWGIGYRLDP